MKNVEFFKGPGILSCHRQVCYEDKFYHWEMEFSGRVESQWFSPAEGKKINFA